MSSGSTLFYVGLTISPNPMTSTARIIADRPLTADDQIEVVDSQGRIVHIASGRGSPEILLERKGLSSGRYSIKLTKGGRLLGVAGFVVE